MARFIILGIMGLSLSGCLAELASGVGSAILSVGGQTAQSQPTYHLVCDDATPSHCRNE